MSVSYGGDSITFADGSIVASGSQGFKNKIINGAMMIDQRNAGASVTINSASGTYGLDRWAGYGQSSDGVFTMQQSSTAPTGFRNSVKLTVTTADSSIGSNQLYLFGQRIEGYNVADMDFGLSTAKTFTLSFWIRSSVVGTHGGMVGSYAVDSCYPFTYTINTADTWEYKTVTITGPTSGTWNTTNDAGLRLWFGLGVGSTYAGTAGAWTSSEKYGASGVTSLISTVNATMYITGVQLEKGTTASSFEFRSIQKELMLCKRYYRIAKWRWQGYSAGLGNGQGWTWVFDPEMRITPSITTASFTNGSSFNLAGPQGGDSMGMYAQGDGNGTVILNTIANAEL